MDIVSSDLSYLGYREESEKGQPTGDAYGITWKIPNNTFKKNMITGSSANNKFHHNYFGLYAYGATGMIIKENEIFNNAQHGINLSDDSNNIIIENNMVYNNEGDGIVIAKRCFNNTIIGNTSYSNKLHGIILDSQSSNNLVGNNVIYGNVDGVAIYDSRNNLIRNNEIRNSESGIRANADSSGNYIEQNKITNNKNGVFFYDNANNNFVAGNFIRNNTKGVYIKNAIGNLIKDSLKDGYNKTEIKIDDGANADYNFIQDFRKI